MRRKGKYFVRLVIVLWIVLEDLVLLGIIEIGNQVIEIELFPPGLAIDEPATRD